MATPSPDDASSRGAAYDRIASLAAGLPDHLRFAAIGVLVLVGGGGAWRLGQPAVAGVALIIALGLLVHLILSRRPEPPPPAHDLRPRPGEPLTIGVLSFTERGAPGETGESAGDGLAEELISRLSRLEDLTVRPQHAMVRYRGSRAPAARIARELKANCIVRGELTTGDGRYRVSVEIVQAWDEGTWERNWERPEAEWFELQADVAEWIAERLLAIVRPGEGAVVSAQERSTLRVDPAGSVDANLVYMDARTAMRRFNEERDPGAFRQAEEGFLRAVELDGSYVEARTMLGFLYLLNWETAGGPVWLEKSEGQFRQALGKAPEHPVADSVLGYLHVVGGRVDEGLERVEAVASLHPRETIPQNERALVHMYLGFYESAVALTREIIHLDPDYIYPPTNASTCCYLMGDCREALRWAEYPEDRAPSAFVVPLVEGAAWFCKREWRAADRAWRRGWKMAPPHLQSLFQVTRAWIHAADGDVSGPRATVRDHRHEPWINGAYGPFFISLCALAGEHDLAVELIARQVTWGASYRYLLGDPTLAPLRSHPGFRELLRSRHARWVELTSRMPDLTHPPPPLPAPDELPAYEGQG